MIIACLYVYIYIILFDKVYFVTIHVLLNILFISIDHI